MTTFTPFKLFWRVILPAILMVAALIESIAASVFLANQPSDLAVLAAAILTPLVGTFIGMIAYRLWFRRR